VVGSKTSMVTVILQGKTIILVLYIPDISLKLSFVKDLPGRSRQDSLVIGRVVGVCDYFFGGSENKGVIFVTEVGV
jgi:hypothetical protein